jgi:ZIP family zinc transporter
MLTQNNVLDIFLLSLIAGLGTGLGGLIVLIRKPGRRSFGFFMGFAAGVMISLSFLELVNEAWQMQGYITATIGFGGGAFFMFLLDFFAPHMRFGEQEIRHQEDPQVPIEPFLWRPRLRHQQTPVAESSAIITSNPFWHPRAQFRKQKHRWMQRNHITNRKLLRTGLLLAIGITIHNIPEGFAVGAGYMHAPKFGIFIAIAILLHNIPEGIATALPLCSSGVCRWDAFKVALFSGMVEPIGALLATLFLTNFEGLIPGALAFAGGVMMFITLDELIPTAREHGHQHATAIGIILGSIFVFLLSGIFGV